jgi:hypothetical protein
MYSLSDGAVWWVQGAAYSFLAFQNGVSLTAVGNHRGEFDRRFLPLAITGSHSADKGFAVETLRVNNPPPGPPVVLGL